MAATRYQVVAYIRRKVQITLRLREVLELSKHLVLPCSPGRQGPQWAARGISTSTYGLGNGFNEDLMVAMARAGGGNHYHGHTANDLMEPFERKLDWIPKARSDWWMNKLAGNKARDMKASDCLRNMGWDVLVILECEAANPRRLSDLISDLQHRSSRFQGHSL